MSQKVKEKPVVAKVSLKRARERVRQLKAAIDVLHTSTPKMVPWVYKGTPQQQLEWKLNKDARMVFLKASCGLNTILDEQRDIIEAIKKGKPKVVTGDD